MEPTKRYFGKVCAKHSELKGERLRSNWTCLGCQRERRRLPKYKGRYTERARTPEYRALKNQRRRTAEYRARERARRCTLTVRLRVAEQDRRRRRHNAAFALMGRLRCRVRSVLHGCRKSAPTLVLLGVPSIEFYKSYLEAQFGPGMTWENAGTAWHIDHRIPLSTLDLSDEANQRFLFNYKNTRPMPADANRRRGNKLVFEDLL